MLNMKVSHRFLYWLRHFCVYTFCALSLFSSFALSTSSFNELLSRNKPTYIKNSEPLPSHWSASVIKQHLSEMKEAVNSNNIYSKDQPVNKKDSPHYPKWAMKIENERSPCTELLHPDGCEKENKAVANAIAEAEEAADKASLTDSNVTAIKTEVTCLPGQFPSAGRTIAIGNLQAAHTRLKIALVDVMHYIREARDKLSAALNTCSGGGDWADKVVEEVKHVREYLFVSMELIQKAHKILLEALQIAEANPCQDDSLSLEIFLRRSHESLLKGWNNLQEAYRASMRGVSASHFKSGGIIGDIIKKAQDSTAILMQDTAGLIDDAAKAAWGSVAGDGKKPPLVDKLTPRMMKKIAEQKALPVLRGPPIKKYSRTGFAASSAFVCAQERELRWTPCFQDLCRHEEGTRQSGCMYGCFAVIAQASQEDDDKITPFRAHVRTLLGKKRIFSLNPLHRALAAIAASTTIPMLNGAMLTLLQGEGQGIEPIYGNSDLTASRTQVVTTLRCKNALNVACNQQTIIDKSIQAAKNARSHEDLFNILSNTIDCKATDVEEPVIVNVDGHGCVHFCTSHVDTVLAHSCENKVAKEVASNFLNTRKGWSRACVLACKQRTSSETFQNGWGEHGGKIQMNPKPATYGGGLPQGPLTVKHIHAGARWSVCNQTICGGKTSLTRSGCIYGCRVMVLTGLPEKDDCDQYCDEVVDQVLSDVNNLGAEANRFDPKSVVVADRQAMWVFECKRGCKTAAKYYPPTHETRYMYERGLGKNPLPPLDKDHLEQRRVMKIIARNDGYAQLRRSRDDISGTVDGTSKTMTDSAADILEMKKEGDLKFQLRDKDIIDDHKQYHLKGKDIIEPKHHNPVYGR